MNIKDASKFPKKKPEKAKPPPKPVKEKPGKPKKETTKPGKTEQTEAPSKSKPSQNQPGLIRGITYYKATKTDETSNQNGRGKTHVHTILN